MDERNPDENKNLLFPNDFSLNEDSSKEVVEERKPIVEPGILSKMMADKKSESAPTPAPSASAMPSADSAAPMDKPLISVNPEESVTARHPSNVTYDRPTSPAQAPTFTQTSVRRTLDHETGEMKFEPNPVVPAKPHTKVAEGRFIHFSKEDATSKESNTHMTKATETTAPTEAHSAATPIISGVLFPPKSDSPKPESTTIENSLDSGYQTTITEPEHKLFTTPITPTSNISMPKSAPVVPDVTPTPKPTPTIATPVAPVQQAAPIPPVAPIPPATPIVQPPVHTEPISIPVTPSRYTAAELEQMKKSNEHIAPAKPTATSAPTSSAAPGDASANTPKRERGGRQEMTPELRAMLEQSDSVFMPAPAVTTQAHGEDEYISMEEYVPETEEGKFVEGEELNYLDAEANDDEYVDMITPDMTLHPSGKLSIHRVKHVDEPKKEEVQRPLIYTVIDTLQFICVGIVIGVLLVVFVMQRNDVYGSSMSPTLSDGDALFVEMVSSYMDNFERGDIVTLDGTGMYGYDHTENLIKRVIGLPGETVSIKDGYVYINGVLLDESYLPEGTMTYVSADGISKGYDEITLGPDEYFCMGDNRGASNDSRRMGPFSADRVKAKVIVRVFPFGDIQFY